MNQPDRVKPLDTSPEGTAKVQISAERSKSGAEPNRNRGEPLSEYKMSAERLVKNQIVKGLKACLNINFMIF